MRVYVNAWKQPFYFLCGHLQPVIIHRISETSSRFSCEIAHPAKSSVSVLKEIFASVSEIFISAWGLSTDNNCMKFYDFSDIS